MHIRLNYKIRRIFLRDDENNFFIQYKKLFFIQ